MSQQQKPRRISLYLNDANENELKAIKQHYGIASDAAAVRRAISEHSKQLKEPEKQVARVTLSRRVY
jgi:hypothetical protein